MKKLFVPTYYKYLFNKYFKLSLVCLISLIIIHSSSIFLNGIQELTFRDINDNLYTLTSYHTAQIGILTAFLFVASTLIPLKIRNSSANKRNCDVLFSLPISRESLFITQSIFGFSMMCGVWSIATILGALRTLMIKAHINYWMYLIYIIVMIFLAFIIFSISSLIISLCNSRRDYFIILIGYNILFILFGIILNSIYSSIFNKLTNIFFNINCYVPCINMAINLEKAFVTIPQDYLDIANPKYILASYKANFSLELIITIIIYFILSVGVIFLTIKQWKNFKAEDQEGIAKNFFSYNFLLPALAFCGFYIIFNNLYFYDISISQLSIIIISIIQIILYYFILVFISKRIIKVDKKALINLLISVLSASIIAII